MLDSNFGAMPPLKIFLAEKKDIFDVQTLFLLFQGSEVFRDKNREIRD